MQGARGRFLTGVVTVMRERLEEGREGMRGGRFFVRR